MVDLYVTLQIMSQTYLVHTLRFFGPIPEEEQPVDIKVRFREQGQSGSSGPKIAEKEFQGGVSE
jgi:hypothetical protein